MAKDSGTFFQSLSDDADFDSERFLTEVNSIFQSDTITSEVKWRLSVLKEISAQPQLKDVGTGLRARLTQIFSRGGKEDEVLASLKGLTEIQRDSGEKVDLRRFLKREKRTLNEHEYRNILAKKTQNTEHQMLNLIAFFPESQSELKKLSKVTEGLIKKIKNPGIPIKDVRKAEEEVRNSAAFSAYEDLKLRFLKDWLSQFMGFPKDQVEGMSVDEIQQLVVEHQRHQMTELLKTKVVPNDADMTQHLGLHDTLECTFENNKDFWQPANVAMKKGFRQWILAVIQTFGMIKGQRYAFFQVKGEDIYLLFGVGMAEIPEGDVDDIQMVPYVKPFTKKANYLLEIRQRELGDPDQYSHEIRHYVLPFLFAFDSMPNFNLSKELITFFTSHY